MVVCCRPAASSMASLTARREDGEPSTGAKIFIDKSEELWEARCGDRDQTADLFELCRQNPHLAVGHLIELIFDALESLEPLKPHPPSAILICRAATAVNRKHGQ